MTNLDVLKCPNCDFTQKEPTLVEGKYAIMGHACKGKYVETMVIREHKIKEVEKVKSTTKKTPLKDRSEKELLVAQTELLLRSSQTLKKIYSNILFFFWITIIGFVFWFFIFLKATV